MAFTFNLQFVLLPSTGGGVTIWQPNADVLILQVDATAPVALSLSPSASYPTTVSDSLPFVCSQAGRFDCGLAVKKGAFLFAVCANPGAYKISLAYQVQTTDPSLN